MVNWIRGKIRLSSAPIWLAVGLLAIATVMVLPNYFTGQWTWSQPPTLPAIKVLKTLRKQGISLAGWQVREQQTLELGHKQWSVQALTLPLGDDSDAMPSDGAIDPAASSVTTDSPTTVVDALVGNYGVTDLPTDMTNRLQEEPIFIFLRPQSNVNDEPLVEWIDLNGMQRWKTDQFSSVHLKMTRPPAIGTVSRSKVSTRYFRGWNQNHTYAVMQWYAWPTGGSPKISDWFWADQRKQWRNHQRMPWIGVMLMVPIKPLGDIAPSQSLMEAIAQAIQSTLVQELSAAMDATV